jgi:RimJ/RimL family protein N-acetyltransferase
MAQMAIATIETERLLLRAYSPRLLPAPTPNDVAVWAACIFADPEVMRYYPRRDLTPSARAARARDRYHALWEQGNVDGWGWVMTHKGHGPLIGHCGIGSVAGENTGEIEYALAQPYWGQGLATEAALAMVRFGFEHTSWDRMVAAIVPGNGASRRVLEHLGFVYEQDVNYDEMRADTTGALPSPVVAFFALRRDQFVPGEAFYRVHGVAS